jgi:hypothetical protein
MNEGFDRREDTASSTVVSNPSCLLFELTNRAFLPPLTGEMMMDDMAFRLCFVASLHRRDCAFIQQKGEGDG